MTSAPQFAVGQFVWHVTTDEHKGIIVGTSFRNNTLIYLVAWSDLVERDHYEIELTDSKPLDLPDESPPSSDSPDSGTNAKQPPGSGGSAARAGAG